LKRNKDAEGISSSLVQPQNRSPEKKFEINEKDLNMAGPIVQRSKMPNPNALPSLQALNQPKQQESSRKDEMKDLLNELESEHKPEPAVVKPLVSKPALPPVGLNGQASS